MTASLQPVPRHARRAALVAALLALGGMLAGCSASGAANDLPADARGGVEYGLEPGADAAGAPGQAGDGSLSAADRAVIVTGSMYMTVDDPISAADRVARIVETAGGRVDARNEVAPDGGFGGSAELTLRIPADRLDSVVDEFRALGTVDEFRTDSADVTNEVTDLAARISTLRASTERIEALLADAEDISDIITLENELARRQAELESLEARQRGLDDQVSLSTLYVSLTTEPVVVVDDSPHSFWDGLLTGWDGLVGFLSGALVVVGVLLPWLALLGLIAAAIVIGVRARRRRSARQASAAPRRRATAPTARSRTGGQPRP